MSERDGGDRGDRGEADQPEAGVDGGTGPGVTEGDVETPGAATTANLPDDSDDSESDAGDAGSGDR